MGFVVLAVIVGLVWWGIRIDNKVKKGAVEYFYANTLKDENVIVRMYKDKFTIEEVNIEIPFSNIVSVHFEEMTSAYRYASKTYLAVFRIESVNRANKRFDLYLSGGLTSAGSMKRCAEYSKELTKSP